MNQYQLPRGRGQKEGIHLDPASAEAVLGESFAGTLDDVRYDRVEALLHDGSVDRDFARSQKELMVFPRIRILAKQCLDSLEFLLHPLGVVPDSHFRTWRAILERRPLPRF